MYYKWDLHYYGRLDTYVFTICSEYSGMIELSRKARTKEQIPPPPHTDIVGKASLYLPQRRERKN